MPLHIKDNLLMRTSNSREPGQALVIMVLAVAVVLAATAVVFDGGNAMVQQRGTQNASDAAALAGAVVIGQGFSGSTRTDAQVQSAVRTAFSNNASTFGSANYVDFNLNQLSASRQRIDSVEASGVVANGTRTFDTLMASLIGQPSWTAGASATAIAGKWMGTCSIDGLTICIPVTFSIPIITCDGTSRPLEIGGDWTSIGDPSQAPAANESIVPLCNTGPGGVGWLEMPGCQGNLNQQIWPPCASGFTIPTWLQTNPGNPNNVENTINTHYAGTIVLCQCSTPRAETFHRSGQPADCTDPGNGNNLYYHIPQVAPFLLDRAYIQGNNHPECNSAPGHPLVGGNGKTGCFKGWFVNEMLQGEVGQFVPCDPNDLHCVPPPIGTQLGALIGQRRGGGHLLFDRGRRSPI